MCGRVGPGEPISASVGFTVAIHVVGVWLDHLSAVETVQEPSGDLRHHRSVWDGLSHAVDRSLKQQEHRSQYVMTKSTYHCAYLPFRAIWAVCLFAVIQIRAAVYSWVCSQTTRRARCRFEPAGWSPSLCFSTDTLNSTCSVCQLESRHTQILHANVCLQQRKQRSLTWHMVCHWVNLLVVPSHTWQHWNTVQRWSESLALMTDAKSFQTMLCSVFRAWRAVGVSNIREDADCWWSGQRGNALCCLFWLKCECFGAELQLCVCTVSPETHQVYSSLHQSEDEPDMPVYTNQSSEGCALMCWSTKWNLYK